MSANRLPLHTLGATAPEVPPGPGVLLVDPVRWQTCAVDLLPTPDTFAAAAIESTGSSVACALGWRTGSTVAITAGTAANPAAALARLKAASPVPLAELLVGADVALEARTSPWPRRIRSRDTDGWAARFADLVAEGSLAYPASDSLLGRQVITARCAPDPRVLSARLSREPVLVAKAGLWAAIAALSAPYLDVPTIW